MSKRLHYKKGDHWVQCQRCATVERSSKIKKEWTGLLVCNECWEPRHEQDFVRARPDNSRAAGPVNPETPDIYLNPTTCTSRIAVAGLGKAGCAVAGNNGTNPDIPDSSFNLNTL